MGLLNVPLLICLLPFPVLMVTWMKMRIYVGLVLSVVKIVHLIKNALYVNLVII